MSEELEQTQPVIKEAAELQFNPQMHQLQNELKKVQALEDEQEEQYLLREIEEFFRTMGTKK